MSSGGSNRYVSGRVNEGAVQRTIGIAFNLSRTGLGMELRVSGSNVSRSSASQRGTGGSKDVRWLPTYPRQAAAWYAGDQLLTGLELSYLTFALWSPSLSTVLG
jgi:hypothetical protein